MKWIKCSDRLPEEVGYADCKQYLIFCGYITIAYWYSNEWIAHPDGFCSNYDPTHWMRLPEVPEDNKNELS